MDHGMDQISEVIWPGGADQPAIEEHNACHAYAISEYAQLVFGCVRRSQTNRINGRKNTLRSVSKTTFGSKATPRFEPATMAAAVIVPDRHQPL
jgi:hypothetical protein